MTKDEKRAYDADRYRARKEEFLARNKSWRDNNKESIRQYSAAWWKENKATAKPVRKSWADKNRSLLAEKAAVRRAADPERARSAQRKYAKNNREILVARVHNRNAKKRASADAVSLDIVDRLMRLQRGRCIVCRGSLKKAKHLDHIVPLISGGPHCDDNLQLLCPRCNLSKGAKDPLVFMRGKGLLL